MFYFDGFVKSLQFTPHLYQQSGNEKIE